MFEISKFHRENGERAYSKYLTRKSFENIKNFITQGLKNV